ncbi:MAG: MATE family efflux transporter [bacterium]|nr:MATE family efflux transporter [bacterium]
MNGSALKNRQEILRGSLWKAVLALAIPVVINSFLQTLYNLTDTYWLGKLGTEQLAAINLVTPVQNIVINFGSGITMAGSVLIAQYVGAEDNRKARCMANQIFVCAMCFAAVCVVLCFLFTPAIVSWLKADGETYRHAVTYLRVVIWDMPFLYMVSIFSAIYQSQGDTVAPMILNMGGILLNLALDPVLIVYFNMGVAGAALATLLAKMAPAVTAFLILTCKGCELCLHKNYMRVEKENLELILKIGLPTALGGSTMQLGFLLMSRNVFAYGTQAMAAYGIGNKINGLITLPSNGIGSAVATIVGQNMGAEQPKRAEKGYRIAMKISVIFLFVGGMILSRGFISRAVVSIFSEDREVIDMASDFLSIMAFWCFANGVYNSTIGLFNGTGHTEISTAVNASRLWVFRFLTLWFCESVLHMGVRSVWYSVVISNGICSVILLAFYLAGIWKKPRINLRGE